MEKETEYIAVGKISEEDRDMAEQLAIKEDKITKALVSLGNELHKVQERHQELWAKWIRENNIPKEKRNRELYIDKPSMEIRAKLWGWEDKLSELEEKADEIDKRLNELEK